MNSDRGGSRASETQMDPVVVTSFKSITKLVGLNSTVQSKSSVSDYSD